MAMAKPSIEPEIGTSRWRGGLHRLLLVTPPGGERRPLRPWSLLIRPPEPGFFHRRVAPLFPHVEFRHLRLGDPLRILLQLLWLLLVIPPARRRPRRTVDWARRRRQLRHFLYRRLPLAARLRRAITPQRLVRLMESAASHPLWQIRGVRITAYGGAVALTLLCITTPFSLITQALFVVLLWVIALSIRRVPGNLASMLLMVLSTIASARYLWWRVTNTLNWDDMIDLTFGLVLLAAELFAWLVLILGYFQTAWPLRRQPAPLPEETRDWPTVDIFIPTYNEPLKVVKPTVLAAMGIDWPRERITIHILDDGRRDEFRRFAEEVGVNYIVRPDNSHAKAGNLNHALARTSGEFIAIFDCDHIPTRSFLQVNMGWFLKDPKLALMQTPHHFFSADPFERNLGNFRKVPNENELFYGLIQDGNDFWDATFFCGSCAILRRGPLEEVGGIAVETVTEDAHTSLRLHRRGYTSAYLNVPQAAGLATESFSAHVGQRIRWARGMVQIFRLDNPLTGEGLSLGQRLCYSNAMLHFLSGIPRLVFLTAPLAFLIFHSYIIHAPAALILLYVLPHMAHASLTNSRLQGKYRHSFWAEVYETALAWYIARPTTVALIDPHKGSFNVTTKGGLIEEEHFDWQISRPHLLLVALNLAGLAFGVWRLVDGPDYEISTVLLNMGWTAYNLLILGAALAVAAEARQVRHNHRVPFEMPAELILADGRTVRATTSDFSEGGVGLRLREPASLELQAPVQVTLQRGASIHTFPGRLVRIHEEQIGVRFDALTTEQEAELVQCTFGRADAWIDWRRHRPLDHPLRSLLNMFSTGFAGYHRLLRFASPNAAPAVASGRGLIARLYTLLPRTPPHLSVQGTTP